MTVWFIVYMLSGKGFKFVIKRKVGPFLHKQYNKLKQDMNKTAIHNIAIAILTLPVFILSVFKPIVKVFSKLSKYSIPNGRERNSKLVLAT